MDVFKDGQVSIEAKPLGEITHLLFQDSDSSPDIAPGHPRLSFIRRKNPAEHPKGGRFAGGIRPHQAEDLPGLHLQVQAPTAANDPKDFVRLVV